MINTFFVLTLFVSGTLVSHAYTIENDMYLVSEMVIPNNELELIEVTAENEAEYFALLSNEEKKGVIENLVEYIAHLFDTK